ncbi:KdsC family phosphatase [Phycisphaera mikurensis]|uniref:3-deoxy-D-manno-octulosonate 8-phosphate phosphatase n=1 Tax=Phycisphaera mikurensis (strain NBRC 102666 / KCTC 22515 / FYK2301M01) TaxID=1142394 RepID=I0IHJ0_PHYMF|nr:HAD hydrolase family protein [Phycisphaera mikurensis]MBB6440972.1 3-deoxy-D-manno-octulosonate 8-phosphate phosphatase (KDO 8-P phosphatase) [Phycisphaera mikurensis]BAM04728.1 3-deoxy-D-manno-octulosonate 8-phosphate phosphatase [Phycisphaera mikurensis NBRC 102666]
MTAPGTLRLLVLDVDGVLTDGGLFYGPGEVELKRFHTRDGLAIKAAPGAGLAIGILTARTSAALTRRAAELGVELVIQGSSDKSRDLRRLLTAARVQPEEAAYMGDDLPDLGPMARCGYAVAPADAAAEVRAAADLVTEAKGGCGAVREAIERLLKAGGRWEKVLAGFTGA